MNEEKKLTRKEIQQFKILFLTIMLGISWLSHDIGLAFAKGYYYVIISSIVILFLALTILYILGAPLPKNDKEETAFWTKERIIAIILLASIFMYASTLSESDPLRYYLTMIVILEVTLSVMTQIIKRIINDNK